MSPTVLAYCHLNTAKDLPETQTRSTDALKRRFNAFAEASHRLFTFKVCQMALVKILWSFRGKQLLSCYSLLSFLFSASKYIKAIMHCQWIYSPLQLYSSSSVCDTKVLFR